MGFNDDRRGGPRAPQSNEVAELKKQVQAAHSKAVDNEKRIQDLENLLHDKHQWTNTAREWIGKKVKIQLISTDIWIGVLKKLDRYTLLVEAVFPDTPNVGTHTADVIIHKGAIATIRLG